MQRAARKRATNGHSLRCVSAVPAVALHPGKPQAAHEPATGACLAGRKALAGPCKLPLGSGSGGGAVCRLGYRQLRLEHSTPWLGVRQLLPLLLLVQVQNFVYDSRVVGRVRVTGCAAQTAGWVGGGWGAVGEQLKAVRRAGENTSRP